VQRELGEILEVLDSLVHRAHRDQQALLEFSDQPVTLGLRELQDLQAQRVPREPLDSPEFLEHLAPQETLVL